VRARPDSWRYRASRFIARNRALVAGGAALAIALAGFAVTAGVQARRIARERDRAERERLAAEDVLAILTGLFERADPNKYPGGDTLRVTSLLDDAERKVGELAKEPDRQAALWRAVGRMRAARGEYARALDLLGRARARRISTHGATDIEAARIRHESAKVLLWYRGEAAARPLLDSSLAELRALLGEEHEEVRAATADLVVATADSNVARALLDRLLALERRAPSRDPVAIASRLNDRGSERFAAGHAGDATTLFEASLALLRDTLPPEDAAVRTVQRNLALALVRSGALARAESLQRASLALEDRLRSAADTRGMAHEALALTLVARGRADSAEAYERTALRLFREAMAPDHWRIWSALRNVAFIAGARGHDDEALALLDSAIALASRNAEGGESAAYLRAQRVPFLLRLGRIGEATRTLADAERGLGASPSVTVPHRADVHRYAAMIALASGDAAAAVRRLRAAVALAEPPGDAQRPASINTCLLGVALARADSIASARAMLDEPCASYLSRGLPDRSIAAWIGEARARSGDRVSR
jgi:tetratricopeptide (TPR) repeat protein